MRRFLCGALLFLSGTAFCGVDSCSEGKKEDCSAFFKSQAASSSPEARFAALEELAFLSLEAGDAAASLDYWNQALSIKPQDAFASLSKAWAQLSLGDEKAAVAGFERVVSLGGGPEISADAQFGTALAHFSAKRYEKAAELLSGLYSREPFYIAIASELLAECYLALNKIPTAQIYLQQSLAHDPRNYSSLVLEAGIYEAAKNPVSAWQAYASLSSLDPEDEFFSRKLAKLSKNLKSAPINYLSYNRLSRPLQTEPSAAADSPVLKLGLFSDRRGAAGFLNSFEVVSASSLTFSAGKSKEAAVAQPDKTWSISFNPETQLAEIRDNWGNLIFSEAEKFSIVPAIKGSSLLVKNARFGEILNRDLGDRELRGSLSVSVSTSAMTLVNAVSAEDCLPGALASARGAASSSETLKALAVVLRSRLVSAAGSGGAYDLCDSEKCLLYQGTNMESPEVKASAKATLGEILVSTEPVSYGDFHTACGGFTAQGAVDWPGLEISTPTPASLAVRFFARPPEDLLCAAKDPTLWAEVKWIVIIDARDVQRRLDRDFKIGKLKAVEPLKRSPDGRLVSVRFIGSSGSAEVEGSEKISAIISAGALRSTLFNVTPLYRKGNLEKILIRGIGTGSGSGLCLAGAEGMAARGKSYREILAHYFPGYEISAK